MSGADEQRTMLDLDEIRANLESLRGGASEALRARALLRGGRGVRDPPRADF